MLPEKYFLMLLITLRALHIGSTSKFSSEQRHDLIHSSENLHFNVVPTSDARWVVSFYKILYFYRKELGPVGNNHLNQDCILWKILNYVFIWSQCFTSLSKSEFIPRRIFDFQGWSYLFIYIENVGLNLKMETYCKYKKGQS